MKIKYKSDSFELEYDDEHERVGHREWSEAANKKCDMLLKLTKDDAETMTKWTTLAIEAKAKQLGAVAQ